MSNRDAFLTMIAFSELGEQLINLSDRGYNVIVGSTLSAPILFPTLEDGTPDYSDHPRRSIELPRLGISSTAAGRYQILARYYDVYKTQLSLPDFSPLSQDKIALQLIREVRALDSIDAGAINEAILLCSSRWASLPGGSYGQHIQTFGTLRQYFTDAGGTLANV